MAYNYGYSGYSGFGGNGGVPSGGSVPGYAGNNSGNGNNPTGGYGYGGCPGPAGYFSPTVPDAFVTLRQGAAQQPIATVSDNSNIIWVSSAKEADNYPLAPNSAVEMRDTNNQFLYVKQRDASGRPNMEAYMLTPVDLSQAATAPAQTTQASAVEYVPRSDFDALLARFDAITAELEALKEKPCKCSTKKAKEDADNG